MHRRSFIRGIIAAALAPAIIRTPGLLMPVKPGLVDLGIVPLLPGIYTGHIESVLNVGDLIDIRWKTDKPLRQFVVSYTTHSPFDLGPI